MGRATNLIPREQRMNAPEGQERGLTLAAPSYSANENPELHLPLPSSIIDAIAELVEQRLLARMPEAAPEWLSIETAATYLDVSPERVRKLVARRALPHYQEGPGCRVFLHRSELDEWMSRSRIAATRHA